MSQRTVESVLGRLITDAQFRARFLLEPDLVCRAHSLDLTSTELAALLSIDRNGLQKIAERLDPRIVRALTVGAGRSSAAPLSATSTGGPGSGRDSV